MVLKIRGELPLSKVQGEFDLFDRWKKKKNDLTSFRGDGVRTRGRRDQKEEKESFEKKGRKTTWFDTGGQRDRRGEAFERKTHTSGQQG